MATKLTPSLLQSFINEETTKLFGEIESVEDRAEETEEVDADEYATALAKKIDYVKALKLEENRLVKRIAKIRESRKLAIKQIMNKVA